jgi:hypothetical protein
MLRAEARVSGDGEVLRAAVDAFEAIDARFEAAVTCTLAPDLAARGYETLDALGCTRPR